MTGPTRYANGRDLLAAVKSRAVVQAKRDGLQTQMIVRQFVYDRLLARLFRDPEAPWILKGGNALMSREPLAARASTDLDLATRLAQERLDVMLARFEAALTLDLGDHFQFIVERRREHQQGETQPNVAGYTVTLTAYCGARNAGSFKVDLVAGTLTTTQAQPLVRSSLNIDGFEPVVVMVYPIVDHVADKVCATAQLYGANQARSSRIRDLVDLVVMAATQAVAADELVDAVRQEWAHRQLPGKPHFDPPASWATGYPQLARDTPGCADHASYDAALRFVRDQYLGPALAGNASGRKWNPATRVWA